jgi:hypothetical protein
MANGDDGSIRGRISTIARQAWTSLAVWLSFGLLLEGLIGFRSPAYLMDPLRRELFRLAHAHGAILNLLLLIAALFLNSSSATSSRTAIACLRIGVILMPLGFVLGGVWHYESDPNVAIVLAPVGGVLIIFSVILFALSVPKK